MYTKFCDIYQICLEIHIYLYMYMIIRTKKKINLNFYIIYTKFRKSTDKTKRKERPTHKQYYTKHNIEIERMHNTNQTKHCR